MAEIREVVREANVNERLMKALGFWYEDEYWWAKHHDGQGRMYATAAFTNFLWGGDYDSRGLILFDTKPAAMVALIGRMVEKGYSAQITVQRNGKVQCDLYTDAMYHAASGHGPTMMQAVALAADAAVGNSSKSSNSSAEAAVREKAGG